MSPSSVVIVCQPRPSSSELEEVVSRSAVTRSVVVPAAVEDVWDALTDPGRLEDWFADEVEAAGFEPDDEVVFRWHEDDEERRAVIEDVDAPRRLVFRWDASRRQSGGLRAGRRRGGHARDRRRDRSDRVRRYLGTADGDAVGRRATARGLTCGR